MELKFKVDTKLRKQWFTDISFSHPAKMSLPLQLWIINKYTKEGEIILDPMAGSGTLLVACSMGRNVICVDLEDKFVKIMEGNWGKIKQRGPQLGYQMGWAKIIQGDARNLERITADAIISSPPYEKGMSGPSREPFWERLANDPTSKRFGRQKHPTIGQGYDEADAIITSPPYEASVSDDKEGPSVGGNEAKYDRWEKGTARKTSYTQDGEPCKVDSIVTSPPYEGSELSRKDGQTKRCKLKQNWRGGGSRFFDDRVGDGSANNIGNLKSDSYLHVMFQVYQQCHQVLKPKGLMVLVIKNFIRDRKVIRLDLDTIKLCEQAGFSLLERHYRRLPAQSFWRVIYYQKNPDVEKIETEDILVFKKIINN